MKKPPIKIRPLWWLPGGFIGITLWPFGIYFRKAAYALEEIHVIHESIHWRQQIEMLGLFFYLWYFIEWIIKLFWFGRYAYHEISFEKEAYKNHHVPDYLTVRKKYAWIKYIKTNE